MWYVPRFSRAKYMGRKNFLIATRTYPKNEDLTFLGTLYRVMDIFSMIFVVSIQIFKTEIKNIQFYNTVTIKRDS